MTLENAFEEFLITQQLRGNSEHTLEYYTNCIVPLLNYVGLRAMYLIRYFFVLLPNGTIRCLLPLPLTMIYPS